MNSSECWPQTSKRQCSKRHVIELHDLWAGPIFRHDVSVRDFKWLS